MMLTCFDEMRVVMTQAFQNMTPGGWIELQDTAFEFFQANGSFSGCVRLGKHNVIANQLQETL